MAFYRILLGRAAHTLARFSKTPCYLACPVVAAARGSGWILRMVDENTVCVDGQIFVFVRQYQSIKVSARAWMYALYTTKKALHEAPQFKDTQMHKPRA